MCLPPSSYKGFSKVLPNITPFLAGPDNSPSYTVLPSKDAMSAFKLAVLFQRFHIRPSAWQPPLS